MENLHFVAFWLGFWVFMCVWLWCRREDKMWRQAFNGVCHGLTTWMQEDAGKKLTLRDFANLQLRLAENGVKMELDLKKKGR